MPTIDAKQVEETRMRITREALDLMRERGYSNVSVEDITRACGISKGSFYTYFPSKDALFTEGLFATYREHILERYRSVQDRPLIERLAYFEEQTWDVIEDWRASAGREWIRIAMLPPSARGAGGKLSPFDLNINMTESLLAEAVEAGELKPGAPVHALAESIVASRIGFEALFCSRDGEEGTFMPSDERFNSAVRPLVEPWLS